MKNRSFYIMICLLLLVLSSCVDGSMQSSHEIFKTNAEDKDTTIVDKTPIFLKQHSIADRIQTKHAIQIFASIIETSDWKDSLRLSGKQWTVLAPSNAVMKTLSLKDSLSLREKNDFIATYILDGTFSTIAISKAIRYRQGVYTLPSNTAEVFQFSRDDMDFVVAKDTVSYKLSLSDVLAQNGLLHVLDTLSL